MVLNCTEKGFNMLVVSQKDDSGRIRPFFLTRDLCLSLQRSISEVPLGLDI